MPTVTRVGSWDVSTIPARWGIETIAFHDDGRQVYVWPGDTHEENVAAFKATREIVGDNALGHHYSVIDGFGGLSEAYS